MNKFILAVTKPNGECWTVMQTPAGFEVRHAEPYSETDQNPMLYTTTKTVEEAMEFICAESYGSWLC